MKIGILQTGMVMDELARKHGQYPGMFVKFLEGNLFEFRVWSVVSGELPDSVCEADGWLVTGSRHAAYEDHSWIPPLEEHLRACVAASAPVVGICFGHQILAQALGGAVEKFEGGWTVGRQEYEINGESMHLNAWHQDQVVRPPNGAEVVGTSPSCRFAALLYGGSAFSVQPHPEFSPEFMADMIEVRGTGLVESSKLDRARADLVRPLQSARAAELVADFFRSAHAA